MASVATAVNWITPAPFPQKFFSSLAAAEAWAMRQLAGKGKTDDDE